MNHKLIVSKLLQPHLLKHEMPLKDSKESREQSSAVSIILRNISKINTNVDALTELSALLNTEILLLQRIQNGKIYSGEICLPGGKRQENETIVQVAIRETFEQSGIRLRQSQLVGVLNERFIAYQRPTHTLVTYVVVFYQNEEHQIKLNGEEMADYKWVPFRHFMNDDVYRPTIVPFPALSSLFEQFEKPSSIKHFEYPAIDVGLKKNLYGLTLYMIAYFFSKLENSLQATISKLITAEQKSENNPKKKEALHQLTEELKKVKKYQTVVRELYFKELRIVWNDGSNLTESEKETIILDFHQKMRVMFPERPHL